MSLSKLLPIPKEEFFQDIRWKYFHHRKSGTFVTTITSVGLSNFDLSTEEVKEEYFVSPVQNMRVERGKLYIDDSEALIGCEEFSNTSYIWSKYYPSGYHAIVETSYWSAFPGLSDEIKALCLPPKKNLS